MAAPLSLLPRNPLPVSGKFVSYAQNFEDVILWRVLKDQAQGFYVDVGAGDPFYDSVTLAFYQRGNWRGINIEPDAELFRLLQEHRPDDINLQVACGPKIGMAQFYCYKGGVGIIADKPEVRAIFENHGHTGYQLMTNQTTLDHVFSKLLSPRQEIHFLKIDVEGYEKEVLEGLDLEKYRPWIIVIEATRPCTQIRTDHFWDYMLGDHHYEWAYFDGLNCFYVSEEHADLIKSLAVPPNIFDNFKKF
jgi:FkbM family methyltransferase